MLHIVVASDRKLNYSANTNTLSHTHTVGSNGNGGAIYRPKSGQWIYMFAVQQKLMAAKMDAFNSVHRLFFEYEQLHQ